MKKRIYSFFALTLVCTGLLSGCGAQLYELTEKEEEVIIQYAAYVLGKHNIYQKDGMVKLEPEEYRETEEVDTQSDVPETETPGGENGDGGEGSGAETTVPESVSLSVIAGHEGKISFQYLGYETVTNYSEGEYFSLDAGEGNAFVVMHFNMKNETEQDADVNLMKISPTFYCQVNGDQTYKCEKSLANQDLCTYLATVKAGEEQEVVLLFKVPEGVAGNITNLELLFDQGDAKATVIL
ncbi:MAG: hypothetical protein J6B26_01900 [Agathobacter sp.]|nr:hypothetical protein [Agathobacter sp.]MBQ2283238.1 hypothetical protein [Agathobacter sp.]